GGTGNESMYVVLSDGTSATASPPQTVGAGATTVTFGGMNASPLADGSISVSVKISDPAGNHTTYNGTFATKDTVPPLPPTSAHVAAGPSNAVDVVNLASVSSVVCAVGFSGSANPTDVATITLSDGTAGVSSPAQPVSPGGTVVFPGVNAGALADGAI